MKSINAKRSGDVAGAKSTIKALDRHNQSAARKGAPTRDNAYGVDKKDLAKAWKTRRKNWNEPTASDAIGLRHSSDDSESQTNAIRLSRKSDDAVSDLIQNKIKLKQMHGGMNRGKGVLGRLARKVKTFLKPGTLSDKDI